jgi:hypothetical protein
VTKYLGIATMSLLSITAISLFAAHEQMLLQLIPSQLASKMQPGDKLMTRFIFQKTPPTNQQCHHVCNIGLCMDDKKIIEVNYIHWYGAESQTSIKIYKTPTGLHDCIRKNYNPNAADSDVLYKQQPNTSTNNEKLFDMALERAQYALEHRASPERDDHFLAAVKNFLTKKGDTIAVEWEPGSQA